MKERPCPRCGETEESKFAKNAKAKDGLQSWCKSCQNSSNADKRDAANPELKLARSLRQQGMKKCPDCLDPKPQSAFGRRHRRFCKEHRNARERMVYDPEKERARSRAKYVKNLENNRASSRKFAERWRRENPIAARLKSAEWNARGGGYVPPDCTVPDVEEALLKQQGQCAACGGVNGPLGETWRIEHCHVTGKFRGIVHQKCNAALGLANDDPKLLRLLADYLERAQE